MRVNTWKVLDRGDVPEDAPGTIEMTCSCGATAHVPIVGRPIAELAGGGIVFDTGGHAMPIKIQCRKCGRVRVSTDGDR